jgi:hypothetical protein
MRATGGRRWQRRPSATDSPVDQGPEVTRTSFVNGEGAERRGDARFAACGGEGSGGCCVGEDAGLDRGHTVLVQRKPGEPHDRWSAATC